MHNGRMGFRGDLRIKVIRAHPTPWRRLADWVAEMMRRFGSWN